MLALDSLVTFLSRKKLQETSAVKRKKQLITNNKQSVKQYSTLVNNRLTGNRLCCNLFHIGYNVARYIILKTLAGTNILQGF